MVNIRPATVWDADKVSNLWHKMFQEITTNKALLTENGNKENLFLNVVTRTKLSDWFIFVAENSVHTEEDPIIGFIMGSACYPRYNPCYVIGTVEALYVKPQYRDNGVYKLLIDKAFEWAETKNVKEVEFVSMNDERIKSFYDRMGYAPVQIVYRRKEE